MKYIFIFTFILVSLHGYAQPEVKHSYDSAGNRVQRVMIPHYVARTGPPLSTQGDKNQPVNELKTEEEELPLEAKAGGLSFSLWPNPTRSQVKFKADAGFTSLANKKYTVVDMAGRLVLEKKIESETFSIDLAPYKPGTYIIRITAVGHTSEWEIVKQ
jgi:hypothetical protein